MKIGVENKDNVKTLNIVKVKSGIENKNLNLVEKRRSFFE